MYIKEKIVQLRKDAGMTQEYFAKAVGVSRQAVYKWEKGISYPEAEKLILIAKLFGVTIDSLLEDDFRLFELKMEKPAVRKNAKKKSTKTKRVAKKVEAPALAEEKPVIENTVAEEEIPVMEEIPVLTVKEPAQTGTVRTAPHKATAPVKKAPQKKQQGGLFGGLRGLFGRKK